MCDRIDLELRVYLTGRPGGQLEWQVIAVEDGGQCRWADGGVSPFRAGTPVTPSALGRALSLELRALCRVARET